MDSGRTARRHMEKMKTARREACVRTAFRRQCHAAVLCCPAMDGINALYSTFVRPNSPSTCGHCLTPTSVVWILFYLVGFHSTLTLYSLLMPVDGNPACDVFAWWQTGSSSSPLMILINLAPGQTLLIYLRSHLPICPSTARAVHFTSSLSTVLDFVFSSFH